MRWFWQRKKEDKKPQAETPPPPPPQPEQEKAPAVTTQPEPEPAEPDPAPVQPDPQPVATPPQPEQEEAPAVTTQLEPEPAEPDLSPAQPDPKPAATPPQPEPEETPAVTTQLEPEPAEPDPASVEPDTQPAATSPQPEPQPQPQPVASTPQADPAPVEQPHEQPQPPKRNWFQRLTDGLAKSSNQVSQGITSIFTKRKLDDEMLEELEDLLITSDVGIAAAGRITQSFAKGRFDKEISPDEVREALASAIADELRPVEVPFSIDDSHSPFVVLVVGVNGSGKTTTIGKLAQHVSASGKQVMMAAGDTFRAAAIEQLKIWGERTGSPVISGKQGSDPASLAFEAVEQAKAQVVDLLLVDTAGRLHNKSDLMQELEKIDRVIKKVEPQAPHACVLVLDATIGQNALAQVETFAKSVQLTGLIVTKLDGTAKGGVLVALADRFKLPVHAIGVGESAEDLQPFDALEYARALVGSVQSA